MVSLQKLNKIAFSLAILLTSALACQMLSSSSGVAAGPTVTIISPANASAFNVGDEIIVRSSANDPSGVARVELWVDGKLLRVEQSATSSGQSPFLVAHSFLGEAVGSHVIIVKAYNTKSAAGESVPLVILIEGKGTPAASNVSTPLATVLGTEEATLEKTRTATSVKMDTPTPSPTVTIAGPTPTPSPSPTAIKYSDTGIKPKGRLEEVWKAIGNGSSRLGYPMANAIEGRNFAKQYFEHGLMIWWDKPNDDNFIWVIKIGEKYDQGQGWAEYRDTWSGGDIYSCEDAEDNKIIGPVRGFGKIWCEQGSVRKDLGKGKETEKGSAGNSPFATVQFFQGGLIFVNPLNSEIWVLINSTKEWRRFPQ